MKPPEGFIIERRGRCRVMVREDVAETLVPWLLVEPFERPADARAFEDGRGGAYRLRLGDVRLVVRECRRGGWVARLVDTHYLGFRPRPFRELIVTEAARRRGIPTAEVLGARVAGVGLYQGVLVTAELLGAAPALTALRSISDVAARHAIASAAGRTVGAMHRLGLHHRDLNCSNLLVSGETPEVHVVDLDRASLGTGPLPDVTRRRTLRRLARSLGKLDREGVIVPPDLRDAFGEGYAETGGGRCVC